MTRNLLFGAVAVLVSSALLATSAAAAPRSGGHSSGSSSGSTSYAYPSSATPVYVVPQPTTLNGSAYFAPDANVATGNAAIINVTVPANAEVWFNDYKTKLSGDKRTFVSPPLNPSPDQSYRYHVRVRWMENGNEVVQERDVPVAPGTQTSVRFGDQATASR